MKKKIYKSINRVKRNVLTSTLDNYARLSIPFFALIIVFGLISYVTLASLAVWNAQKRTAYEKDISEKSTSVVDLETKLSSINKNITASLALSRGFIETHEVKYVTTKSLTTASRSNETEL